VFDIIKYSMSESSSFHLLKENSMKQFYLSIIFALLMSVFIQSGYSQEIENDVIQFTENEKNWIENNKEITFGADFKWPPFDFADKNDKHSGLSADYIRVIEKKTGIKINVIPGVWSYILDKAKKGTIDGISATVRTSKREEYLKFSDPFIKVPLVIITRSDNLDINEFNDLKDKVIAVSKDSYIQEYIQKNKLDVYPMVLSSNKECIEAVSFGNADAYIGNLPVYTHISGEELITNLKVVNEIPNWSASISLGVTNNDSILLNIINKVLHSISEETNREFRSKWFDESVLSTREIELSRRENKWLIENPEVKIAGEPNWAPLSYYNNKGEYVGIIPDIWKLVEKRSGIKFKRIGSENWQETIKLFKSGKIDVVEAITPTGIRKEYADFSNVYIQVDYVIVTNSNVKYIKNFKSLDLTTIGVVEGYEIQEQIVKKFPNQKYETYKSAEEGLKALSYGEIYAFIIDVASFEYYSKKNGLSNIKISGNTPFFYEVAIGVRKGNRELVSILNKALKTISEEEFNIVFERWSTINELLIDYSLLWKVILSAFIILVFIFYWNRRLAHEIALRKKTEIELKQARDFAEKATNAKSEFLANMSHEIRTPMNAVIGFTELMEKTTLTNKQVSYLSTIKAGGNTLLSLINDVLDISKIEAKKLEVRYSSFDVFSTIYEIQQFFHEEINQKGLELIIEHDTDFKRNIILDESRLRQILFNLISNAIKYTNSGYIKLTTKFKNISMDHIDLFITIEDTGIGIKEENLSNIFDPFVQVGDPKVKRIMKGTGLGLAITNSLVELMNGSIKIKSELKIGTKLSIEFNNVKLDGHGHEIKIIDKSSEEIVFNNIKVLIADDVESNRMLLRVLCEEHGFDIIEAENGREAIDKTKLYVPDLILMDIRMPVIDGYEAIRIIKDDPNLKKIPIIAVTASVMVRDSIKLKKSQFSGYIRKPISRKELVSKFKEFVPYSAKEQDPAPILLKDEPLDPEIFYAQLNGPIYIKYKNAIEKQNLKDIKCFAELLDTLGNKHHSNSILNYSEELILAVNNFDIGSIKSLLSKFDKLIKR
jgi:two-component system sensor histidine kinase EvgS